MLPETLPDTEVLSVSWSPNVRAQIAVVRSTLARDLKCPFCGETRRPNGKRIVRFRDIPFNGEPHFIDWKRQHYRCHACGRASNERHPAFEQNHFITHRFVEWIKDEAKTKTFVEIAKQAGMNQSLLRRIFHSDAPESSSDTSPRLKSLGSLGIELVELSGRIRPLLVNVEECFVIDVLESNHALKSFLAELSRSTAGASISRVLLDIMLDDVGVLQSAKLQELFPSLQYIVISGPSLVRHAVKMMVDLSEPLFKSCADEEHLSPKSARNLFCRRRHDLRRSAKARLNSWETISPKLFQAYHLKERFIEIWLEREMEGWADWPSKALSMPDLGYKCIIELVRSKMAKLMRYQDDPKMLHYQSWMDDIRKFESQGTHSFAAARLAILAKYAKSH